MKKMALIIILTLAAIISLYLVATKDNQGQKSSATFSKNVVENFLLDDQSIIDLIDEMAGLPSDPDLPGNVLGASDLVLESTNPRELADLITMGLNLAKKNVNHSPRSLLYLGRVGYYLGYPQSINWVRNAAKNGSKSAIAYLGYIYYDKDEYEKSKQWLVKAINLDYSDEGQVQTLLDELNSTNITDNDWFNQFNRPDIIKALYDTDFGLLSDWTMTSYYIGAIQNTLWESEILFLVNDVNFILELDPSISAKLGLVSKKTKDLGIVSAGKLGSMFGEFLGYHADELEQISLITDQATQDARRLALLYEDNPEAFRKIYQSMSTYSKNALKIKR